VQPISAASACARSFSARSSSVPPMPLEPGDARISPLCLAYEPCRDPWLPCSPWPFSRIYASARSRRSSCARRSSFPSSGFRISLAAGLSSWLLRPCVWPLASSFRLPAYLDCFRVSVVKSSAYRRRKQLTYKLDPTTSNRLAVIAAGSRSLQPFDVAQLNIQTSVCSCTEYRRRTTESGNPIQEDA
jgi:hypothetical protein